MFAGSPGSDYTLYLVRHAEKQVNDSHDPELTEIGRQRAVNLAHWLEDKDIADVWSSDYIRTRDTAAPMISSLGLSLNSYDPGDQTVLVGQLSERGRNALIVGHSNTIPELARLLCHCYISDMEDTEYERLIVIVFSDGKSTAKVLFQNQLKP